MKNNQQGFSVAEVLLIVVVASLLGLVGWFVWQRNDKVTRTDTNTNLQSENANTKSNPAEVIPDGYTKYVVEEGSYSFYYPTEWKLKYEEVKDEPDFVTIFKINNEDKPYFSIYSNEKSPTNNCSSDFSADAKSIKVASISGFQYDSDARGDFHTSTCFIKNNLIYKLQYNYEENKKDTEIEKYNTLVTSFKFI
ncbi:MAG: hypothetical protein M3Q36_00880 [bacterium]|nr:hypothetical protein [bacterium]